MKDVVFWKNAIPIDKLYNIEIFCHFESSTKAGVSVDVLNFWKYDGIKESYTLDELIHEINESIKKSISELSEADRFDVKFKKLDNRKGEIEIRMNNSEKRVTISFTDNFQKLFGLDVKIITFVNTKTSKLKFEMFDLLKYYDNRNDIVKYLIVIEPKNYDTLDSLLQEIHKKLD